MSENTTKKTRVTKQKVIKTLIDGEWTVLNGQLIKAKHKKPKRAAKDLGLVEELLAATDGGKELVALMLNQSYGVKEMSSLAYAATKFLLETIDKHNERELLKSLKLDSANATNALAKLSDEELLNMAQEDKPDDTSTGA